jgi:hypothetical protein
MLSVGLKTNLEERSLENDLKYGLSNEDNIIDLLNRSFGETFVNTKEKYNDQYYPYDFEGDKGCCIELKSRRNTYKAYPTTILPVGKILEFNNKKQIFVFQFVDGFYYTEYEPTRFNKYEIKMITTTRKGIVDKPKPHFCIPIGDLIKL